MGQGFLIRWIIETRILMTKTQESCYDIAETRVARKRLAPVRQTFCQRNDFAMVISFGRLRI